MAFKPGNRLKKLMLSVAKDEVTGCWNWMGACQPFGYGLAAIAHGSVLAHRTFYTLIVGAVPDGLDLDHLCRNRRCVNPAHLEPVTRSVNLRRGFEARGCKNGHPYRAEDFSVICRPSGVVERRCKECHRQRNKLAKRRKNHPEQFQGECVAT